MQKTIEPLSNNVIISVEKFHEAQLKRRKAKEEEKKAHEEAEKKLVA